MESREECLSSSGGNPPSVQLPVAGNAGGRSASGRGFGVIPVVFLGICLFVGLALLVWSRAALDNRTETLQSRVVNDQGALLRNVGRVEAAIQVLQDEHDRVVAGRMSERESDERSRTVHAPVFRQLLRDLNEIPVAASDVRFPLARETRRMTELILESLEMQSIYREGSAKPEPADPKRMAMIEKELREAMPRFQKLTAEARVRQKP